jgi:YegS/Rv2252/BmrU family lipid kinase
MKITIIANPASGNRTGAHIAEEIRQALATKVDAVDLVVTTCAGEGERIAHDADADCLVSVGGDGTANEVLNGMNGRSPALALYPAGTANVVARQLGIRKNIPAFAELVTQRSTRFIDGGEANGRRFLLGIGAGLDALIAKQVAAQKDGIRGLARWVMPAVRSVLHFNHAPIRVRVDGEIVTETSSYAIVANCRYSAGVFPATRRARVDDGLLDLCAMHRLSVPKLAWLPLAVWSPRFPDRKDVVYRQGKEFVLEAASDLPVPLHVDGEPAGFLPATCQVKPKSFEVIAPVVR